MIGTEAYVADHLRVQARGATLRDDELDEALSGPVSAILWDDAGQSELEMVLAGLAETEFEDERLREILENTPAMEDWRVGEAMAEAYLIENRSCEFPWPTGRDLKNPSASPAGTDLVGFQHLEQRDGDDPEEDVRFAFGEVKTSVEEAWPPAVTHGRHGLVTQIENLRDKPEVRGALVRYLALHAALGAAWGPMFRKATKRYLRRPGDIALFGVLIRDVEPKHLDLRSRARRLAEGCPADTAIELRALYLPAGSIPGLPERALRARARR